MKEHLENVLNQCEHTASSAMLKKLRLHVLPGTFSSRFARFFTSTRLVCGSSFNSFLAFSRRSPEIEVSLLEEAILYNDSCCSFVDIRCDNGKYLLHDQAQNFPGRNTKNPQ